MIRTQTEIDNIINRSQHALASIGSRMIENLAAGMEESDRDIRDDTYRIEIIRASLQVLLTPAGDVKAYFLADVNAKKFNAILDALQRLSGLYTGPSIPMLGRRNLPLYYYPSSSTSGGQQVVTPGGTTFQNVSVDSPGEIVDQFDANLSSFAYYIWSASGQNPGEGNRAGFFIVTWRGSSVDISGDPGTPDVGGSTAGVSFSAAIVGGRVQITCNVPSNGWVVRGVRILFQNSSYLSQQGDFPNGIRTDTSGAFWKIIDLPIGAWNMNTDPSVGVPHGLTPAQAATIQILGVSIYPDDVGVAGALSFPLDRIDSILTSPVGLKGGGVNTINSTGFIVCECLANGFFATIGYFVSTAINRGIITIKYNV